MTFKNLGWDGVQCLFLHASAARCKIMYFIGYKKITADQITSIEDKIKTGTIHDLTDDENVSFVQIEDVNFNADVLVLKNMSLLQVIFHGEINDIDKQTKKIK